MELTGPQRPSLTRRQRDIFRFCEDYIECNGYPPTLREIGVAVELKSTSSVSYQVRELQRKDRLSRGLGRPRTTMPTRAASTVVAWAWRAWAGAGADDRQDLLPVER